MEKRTKKILSYGVRSVVGGIIAIYWYYYLKGWVPQNMTRFILLSFITFIFVASLFKGAASPKDDKGDKIAYGSEGHF